MLDVYAYDGSDRRVNEKKWARENEWGRWKKVREREKQRPLTMYWRIQLRRYIITPWLKDSKHQKQAPKEYPLLRSFTEDCPFFSLLPMLLLLSLFHQKLFAMHTQSTMIVAVYFTMMTTWEKMIDYAGKLTEKFPQILVNPARNFSPSIRRKIAFIKLKCLDSSLFEG